MSAPSSVKKALICGIGGQDGAYLTRLLLDKGYQVWGTSRDAQMATFNNLRTLGAMKQVKLLSMAPNDFRSALSALTQSDPDEVFFLAGQSSVGLSFEQPTETLESITLGTLNLLEAMRFLGKPIRLYHASSSESFGDLGKLAATESTPFRPRSPYAIAKASAHWLVANYREAYGLFACNGILFNHESPLRPERFVTRKIVSAARRIAEGSGERLALGRLDIVRDWGWAPEYVDAMWRMMQKDEPDDYIIATGEANSLQDFVAESFALVGLDWREHVDSDPALFRPTDLAWSQGNPEKAAHRLGWRANTRMKGVVARMMKDIVSQDGPVQ
jgi:GDPmannose 4,6-dehydratase